MLKRTLACLVCAVLVALVSSAQERQGSIEGVIKDSSGGVLPGAVVEVRSPALVGVSTGTTDKEGRYRFPALPPGRYEVTAQLSSFGPARVADIDLDVGKILQVNLSLRPAAVSESVQVVGEAPLIDVKQNSTTANIDLELIARVPKGRDFTTVVDSAPGTTTENRNGGIQVDGASGSENRYVVDGMDTTAMRTGTSNKEVLTDVLQEVQVKSSGYNAEYRAATGGVISAITKSGSNAWSGSVGTYFNSDNLQGQARPSLRQNPSNQTVAEYVTTKPDDYRRFEPVFELGGPVMRDRAWFYAAYIPQLQHTERTVTFRSNQQTQTFGTDSRDHNLYWNLSAKITDQLRGKFSAINERQRGDVNLPGIEPDGTSLSNVSLFPSPIRTDSFNDLYVLGLDWTPSSRLYVNVTTGTLNYGSRGKGAGTTTRRVFSGSNFQFANIPDALKNTTGYADALSNSNTVLDDYRRLTFNTDATYYGSWHGQHAFKAGVQLERITNDVDTGNQAPVITFVWDASRATLDGRRVRGQYGYYYVDEQVTFGNISTNNVGLFLQDAWTVRNRLTFNLGVRVEKEDVPSYRQENPGIHFGFGDKLAPRAGFAWDVRGDGRWKGYGSWGMFYDITKLEMPRGSFGADHWIRYYYGLDTFDWPSVNCSYPPVSGPTCPGAFIEQVDFRHPANEKDNNLIDPGLKPLRSQEATLGLDHELTKTLSVGVRYARKWLDRTIEDVGTIVPGVGEVFRIGNPGFGVAQFTLGPDFPAQPPARRTYDGLEVRVNKRLADRWSLSASYLLSRLQGNYGGLASSDEVTNGSGRNSPNVDRYFDGIYYSYDARGQAVYGVLPTDRPHQFKALGSYDLPWGTSVGAYFILESGTPITRQISEKGIPVFYRGRGSDGRTPTLSQTDLLLQQRIKLGGRRSINVSMNVSNLFDQDTPTGYFSTVYRDGFNVSDQVFFAGFDPDALAAASPSSYRPDARFLQANSFLGRRSIRLGMQLTF